MQFIEEQERQVYYRLSKEEDLEFEPIFDKMLQEGANQIAVLFPKSYFLSEEHAQGIILSLPFIKENLQKKFKGYICNYGAIQYEKQVIIIEGYYKKCDKNFEDMYDHDVLIILYLLIRPRKNIDGIKSLIKVGEDYEL